MNPIVHGELSWLVAHRLEHRRDRLLVTVAGVLPDLDGLSLLGGEALYGRWHHVLTHGVFAALAISGVLTLFARRRLVVFALCVLAYHLHLICDLAGSGPGWPIEYLWPIDGREWSWSGQWDLASWQNTVIGLATTLAALACALSVNRTVVEVFSVKADVAVVKAVRRRFLPSP